MTCDVIAPTDLGPAGRSLWAELVAKYDFSPDELVLVVEVVRQKHHLDALMDIVAAEGLMTDTAQGRRAPPAVAEARQARIAFARLLSCLRLPDEEGGQAQRRPGIRGHYSVGQRLRSA